MHRFVIFLVTVLFASACSGSPDVRESGTNSAQQPTSRDKPNPAPAPAAFDSANLDRTIQWYIDLRQRVEDAVRQGNEILLRNVTNEVENTIKVEAGKVVKWRAPVATVVERDWGWATIRRAEDPRTKATANPEPLPVVTIERLQYDLVWSGAPYSFHIRLKQATPSMVLPSGREVRLHDENIFPVPADAAVQLKQGSTVVIHGKFLGIKSERGSLGINKGATFADFLVELISPVSVR